MHFAFRIIFTLLISTLPHASSLWAAERPNIVFVLADDLGWADVGYNGAEFYETPHIDKLAAEGLRVDRFYPGGPNCAPTRACLMTGMYTPRHQLYQPGGKSKGDVRKMRWKVPTRRQGKGYQTFQSNNDWIAGKWTSIAELLKSVGYATARIGKWHLGNDTQGFDFSTNDGVHDYGPNHNSSKYSDINVAEQLTDRAMQFVEEHQEQPFFLYLSHWEVHTALAAKKKIVDKYKQKLSQAGSLAGDWNPTYAAEIEVVDQSVGRLRAKLAELGLADNTLFIFSSDNGGLPEITSNKPLRGGKGSLFEGGIRTPLVAVWPQQIEAGITIEIPVTGVDLLPTVVELAGAELPKNQPVDGVSIVPLLQGKSISDRAIFWHYPLYLSAHKKAQVLPVYGTDKLYWRGVPASAVMSGDWKLIYYYEYDNCKLFNLRNDPGEQHDLAAEQPVKANELEGVLKKWLKQTNAPIPSEPNPAFATSS